MSAASEGLTENPQVARDAVADAYDQGVFEEIDDETAVDIIKEAAHMYDQALDREYVSKIADRHYPAVQSSTDQTIEWMTDIETYLDNAFGTVLDNACGTVSYTEDRTDETSYIRRSPEGPGVVVLPRNDRGDLSPYVASQMFLAKAPFILHPSSEEAGEYAAATYINSLKAAVAKHLPEGQAAAVYNGMHVMSQDLIEDQQVAGDLDLSAPMEEVEELLQEYEPFSEEQAADVFGDIVEGVVDTVESAQEDVNPIDQKLTYLMESMPEEAQLVLFGSDKTLDQIQDGLHEEDVQLSQTVQLGEGRSAGAILDNSPERVDEYAINIAESAVRDRGDDCTTMDVLYVNDAVYGEVVDELQELQNDFQGGGPMDSGAAFVQAPEDIVDVARSVSDGYVLGDADTLKGDRLNLTLLHPTADPIREYPMPVLQIRKVDGVDDFVETMKADMADRKNLVTTIYTEDKDTFNQVVDRGIPTHRVRRSAPTATTDQRNTPSHLNLMHKHQDMYLVRELLGEQVIEEDTASEIVGWQGD